jgi:hypothetical protein
MRPNNTARVALLVAVGVLAAACGGTSTQTPTTTTTTTTTPSSVAPPTSPTEKSLSPSGGNLFSPQVLAPPAPTEPPGVHRKH